LTKTIFLSTISESIGVLYDMPYCVADSRELFKKKEDLKILENADE
jgi:hypothetical protein